MDHLTKDDEPSNETLRQALFNLHAVRYSVMLGHMTSRDESAAWLELSRLRAARTKFAWAHEQVLKNEIDEAL